jgi:Tetratricopeptide repeat
LNLSGKRIVGIVDGPPALIYFVVPETAADLRRFEEAIAWYRQSLAICREVGARYGEGSSRNRLGAAHRDLPQWKVAIDCCQQDIAI